MSRSAPTPNIISFERSSFLSFPDDVGHLILVRLDYRDLVACSQVCRSLRRLILTSDELNYKIGLGLAGYQDGTPNIPLHTRIELFREHQHSWASLSWTAESILPFEQFVDGDTVCVRLLDDHPGPGNAFVINRIGSVLRGIEEKRWEYTVMGPQVRQSTTDSYQDLLVVVRYPDSLTDLDDFYLVQALKLSTGEQHPDTSQGSSWMKFDMAPPSGTYPQGSDDLKVEIFEKYIAILWIHGEESEESRLRVWDWKTGEMIFHLECDGVSCAFLTSHQVVLTLRGEPSHGGNQTLGQAENSSALMVLDITKQVDQYPKLKTAIFDAVFELPEMEAFEGNTGWLIDHLHAATSPSLAAAAPTPFCASQDPRDRLLVLQSYVPLDPSSDYNEDSQNTHLIMFVPTSTLISRLTMAAPVSTVRRFSWKEWGPRGTRLEAFVESEDVPGPIVGVAGYKCVCVHRSSPNGEPPERPRQIELREFSPAALRRAHLQQSEGSVSTVVVEASKVVIPTVFTGAIQTSFPYVSTVVDVGHPIFSVHMCEDAIILGCKTNLNQPQYRVLSF